ncbi:hypothetical protein [Lacipirellula parvula]|uniref:Uncharacterized protein n=1 Tax=Lacipirellula parvula TaxID=2650471 RepID=A0A5K7XME9_9BACT|nr:hypothetical protein [Lacipirellula parvula]BBO34209.1 hypothetical protein PLANPX_3821 [Lacipirellula parvula]
MLTLDDPWTVYRSYRDCPCRSNRRALVESIASKWLPATAGKFLAKTGSLATPDRFEELLAASILAVVEGVDKLTRAYDEVRHLRADVNTLATKAMITADDDARPSGLGPTAAAKYQRRRRGTEEARSTDPKAVSIDPGNEPRDRSRGKSNEEYDFAQWVEVTADEQVESWKEWEALAYLSHPLFATGKRGRPNIAAIARHLGTNPDTLRDRLKRLGQRVAAACNDPDHREILEKLLEF